ncbi:hypothetical protein IVB30_32140 [Bradyrhizobium sp. 200]|nr:hypothetical protein [Bradyrhizobium sp. 200]UPJ47821.1 hypothetical protein IVB30_32140 [Bradyrhizobium sp. 200]
MGRELGFESSILGAEMIAAGKGALLFEMNARLLGSVMPSVAAWRIKVIQ